MLFQAGPNHPWILETYSEEVPYPYASSMAQEIFQSGIIPGDTDYRIFRDFGNLSGILLNIWFKLVLFSFVHFRTRFCLVGKWLCIPYKI